MRGAQRRQGGKNTFDLIEEATQLLRTAPVATLATYYAGAIPFVLGLLYFWADMSRSPFAPQHLGGSALGLALLFLWMKSCQAVFAGRVRAQAAAGVPLTLDFRRCMRIFLSQAVIQPSALFVLPLATIPILPFGWVYAFYQNATVLADAGEKSRSDLWRNSWAQARLWPRQNHEMLVIMMVFGFCVFLNWVTAGFTLPELVRMLFGTESQFSMSPKALMNTTFFAGMAGLTYLCVDPLLKTIYVLRCFYGESMQSGEDLKAELAPLAATARPLAAALVMWLAFAGVFATKSAGAEDSVPAPIPVAVKPAVSPPDLDHVINETIHEKKYTWRMPREKTVKPDSSGNVITRFLDSIGTMFRSWAHTVADWLEWLLQKLFPSHRLASQSDGSSYGWMMSSQILLYALIAAVISALVIFLMRVVRARRSAGVVVASEPMQSVPDITDENVRADQLPEDGWIKLARELLERGEFRAAMRAFYLSSLAHLAGRNLINLARFKSNRDYERELRRRAHAIPDLLPVFGENLLAFEGVWYGLHEVNRERVESFAANVERIRAEG